MFGLILICVVSIFIYFLYSVRARPVPGIPMPPALPFFGHTFMLLQNKHRVTEWHSEWIDKFKGKTWHFVLPGLAPSINIYSPENLEYVLKTNFDNFPKGEPFITRMHDLLGRGIFNVDGDAWRVQRKTASHVFTMRALQQTMTDVFLHHGDLVIKKLESLKPGEPIDMHDLFHRFTLDSFALIAFGVDLHCLHFGHIPFARSFDLAQRILDERFTAIHWRFTRWLGIGNEGKLAHAIKVVKSTVEKIIDERVALSESQLEKHTDLLSMFIGLRGDEDGKPFTKEYLRDIVLNFIIAGRDTTAQCLSWMFWRISQNPAVQDKLVQEIETVLQGDPPSYDNMNRMPYAHAVCQETLRLHPSVPRELKHAVKACTLPDGTHIPAGAAVIPLIQCMGRQEQIWGPTAATFDPQRWLDMDSEPSPFKFPAFQAGPRTCLGKHMAFLEAKLLMSMILQKFHVTLVPGQTVEPDTSLTLPMRYPLLMTVTPRP